MAEAVAENGGNPARQRVAELFANGMRVPAIAKTVGVAERTVYRWLAAPDVLATVDEIRAGMVSAAAGRLTRKMHRVVSQLELLLKSADERIRLAVIRAHLDMLLALRRDEDLERRLRALEARVEPPAGKPTA